MRKRFVAIVPARGGSKGLPGKNIADLCGKPLMAWSIEAGTGSRYVDKVVVSSDSGTILDVARAFGAEPLRRPDELATDSAPSEPLITHALGVLEARGERYDYVVLLQPTSPLRDAADLDRAVETLLARGAQALISVYEPLHTPYKAFKVRPDGRLEGLVDNETPFKRRQDLPPVYMPNGAIYITDADYFRESGRLFAPDTVPFVMPESKSPDIDTAEDLEAVRARICGNGAL